MKMFVGVTDYDWYTFLKEQKCDEINFWTPSGNKNFRAIGENELFLFKLHAPRNYIVGGGFFVRFSILPVYLAWDAFGIKNGVASIDELDARIMKYKKRNRMDPENAQIGCIILTEPFFFDEKDWIPVPADWSPNIVQGKTYNTDTMIGGHLYETVVERIPRTEIITDVERYVMGSAKHRIGQGAFRVAVTDAYQRRCAVCGEKTLPVLQAAHIKPYAEEGTHSVTNGLLLRSDIHTLFDRGYITVDTDYRINVSAHLHSDYGNGKDYYQFDGKELLILPTHIQERPSPELLQWHNENVYRG